MTVHIFFLFAIIHTHVMMNNTILWLTSKLTLAMRKELLSNKRKKCSFLWVQKKEHAIFQIHFVIFFCERFNCFYGQILKMMRKVHQHLFCWFFLCANFFVIFLSTPFDDQFDIIENWRIYFQFICHCLTWQIHMTNFMLKKWINFFWLYLLERNNF